MVRFLVTAAVLMLVAALSLAYLGKTRFEAADQARDQAATLHDHLQTLRQRDRDATRERKEITNALEGVRSNFESLGTSIDAAIDSHNHVADVFNSAVEHFNGGRLGESDHILNSDGAAAVADEATKVTATRNALTTLQSALRSFDEVIER
jgi:hypothetical protein